VLLYALCAPLLGIYPVFMMKLLCFAMFACAYNLLMGFGGMLSFGHAAFFGASAYATAWLATARAGMPHRRYRPVWLPRPWWACSSGSSRSAAAGFISP